VLNAKTRTIGVDVATLDAQVAAKDAADAAAAEVTRKEDEALLAVDTHLKLVELDRQRIHKEASAGVREFNSTYMTKDTRKEWILSDPKALQREAPTRMGDDDPRLGLSSLQIFAGEDLKKAERVKAQQAQQRNWIEQQVYEKAVIDQGERDYDNGFAQNVQAMTALRGSLEAEEAALRKELTRVGLQHNEDKRLEKEEEQKRRGHQRVLDERIQDYREMAWASTNDMLNETKPQYNSNGRVNRTEYRGLSKSEWKANESAVLAQQATNAAMKDAAKAEDLYIDSVMNNNRSLLVAAEREKGRQYKALGESIISENADLIDPTKNKRYDTAMDPAEYFKFFGTSTR